MPSLSSVAVQLLSDAFASMLELFGNTHLLLLLLVMTVVCRLARQFSPDVAVRRLTLFLSALWVVIYAIEYRPALVGDVFTDGAMFARILIVSVILHHAAITPSAWVFVLLYRKLVALRRRIGYAFRNLNERMRKRRKEERQSPQPQQNTIQVKAKEKEQVLKATRRREAVYFECQMLYDRHANELQDRFPRQRLEEYFERHMSERHGIDEVVSRGGELKKMLREIIEENGNGNFPFSSLAEIRSSFQKRYQEVNDAGFDEGVRQSLLSDLAMEEERTYREFRER